MADLSPRLYQVYDGLLKNGRRKMAVSFSVHKIVGIQLSTVERGTYSALFIENLNASRLSEHPPVRRKKNAKRLGGIIGCKDKTYSRHLIGFPYGSWYVAFSVDNCLLMRHLYILYFTVVISSTNNMYFSVQ